MEVTEKDEIEITCSVDSNTCSETTVEDGIKLPCSGITDESVSSSPAADEKYGSYIFLIPKEYGVTQPTYEGYLPAAAADENYRPYIFFVIPEEYGVMPPTYKAYPPGWICVDTGYRAIPPDWDAVPPIEGTPVVDVDVSAPRVEVPVSMVFPRPKVIMQDESIP
ncbi:PREDICTED: uncharacterized protein LOC105958914 [Erythranthe guttata]|uniref:uncharacterized protein LOC105958914 n=1 Tax=Erythranthe guttata TaxID=4155 RepID=UPI00064D910A|nr:PREDICTED: uncharacterized protein LOC105958914 [Erythranthe guttata]|eukprot:XP_012838370.1 PREDICTED: uncharacterized protein LOC105958914 [Erythranthe guttata]